jgi:hypothetical protein
MIEGEKRNETKENERERRKKEKNERNVGLMKGKGTKEKE